MSENDTPPTTALVAVGAQPARTRLHESLVRLDTAARARVVTAGGDLEHMVIAVAERLEARAVASVRKRLHAHTWLALGIALGCGVILGTRR